MSNQTKNTKVAELVVPSEWVKLAKAEVKSIEKADLSSMAFFKESREVLTSELDRKGMTTRLNFWIDTNVESKGIANRLKKIVKFANDSIDLHIGDAKPAKGEKLHISLNLDIIHWYNLEEVIKLKKLMTKEFEKSPSERLISGNKIKDAQKEISKLVEISEKIEYNNALTDTISSIKNVFGIKNENELQVSIGKRVQSFETFLKTLPVADAGKLLAKINEDFRAWKDEALKTPADSDEKTDEKAEKTDEKTEKAA